MPDPGEASKDCMEPLGMKQKDLAEVMGVEDRGSEMPNHTLTLDRIRKVNDTPDSG